LNKYLEKGAAAPLDRRKFLVTSADSARGAYLGNRHSGTTSKAVTLPVGVLAAVATGPSSRSLIGRILTKKNT